MNQSPEPNPPIAPVVAELVAPPPAKPVDPLIEIQQLREQQRRWKGRFLAVSVAFVFLLVVSVLQFVGTFITCQVLYAARRDSEHAQRQTRELLKDLAEARNSLNQADKNLNDSRRTVGQLDQLEAMLQRLDSHGVRLAKSVEDEARRVELLKEAESLREDAGRQFAEAVAIMKRRLREADGLLSQMYDSKGEFDGQQRPSVDPNHKHPRACPVDQWPGVRGVSTMREPTAEQREEEEHLRALFVGPPIAAAEEQPLTKAVLLIFQAKCSKCHIENTKAKLSLKSLADVLKGGESGPAVVFGSLNKSELWQAISDRSMPPRGEPKLTETEIDIIQRWITGKE